MEMLAILSGSGYGSGVRRTVSIRLKIAVLAPIPNPRTSAAVIVNPGDLKRSRRLYRKDANKPCIVPGEFLK
jgi:hypothetical protein